MAEELSGASGRPPFRRKSSPMRFPAVGNSPDEGSEGSPRATTHEAPPSASIGSRGALRVSEAAPAERRDPRARKRFRTMVHVSAQKASGAWRSGGDGGLRFEPSRGPRAAATIGKNHWRWKRCAGEALASNRRLLPGGDRRVATDQHARSEKKPAGRTESLRDVEPVDDPLHLHLLLRRFLRRISMGPRRVVRHRRLLCRRLRLLLRRRAHGLDQ